MTGCVLYSDIELEPITVIEVQPWAMAMAMAMLAGDAVA